MNVMQSSGRRAAILATIRLGWAAICALLALAALGACRATPTPSAPIHLRIGAADSTQYIAREAVAAFRAEHSNATFDFFKTNSTMSLRQLAFGQYDFALVERNPRADELERAQATAYELGRDGVFLITHPANALRNLTRAELGKIMRGEINRWSQLGIDPPGGQDTIQTLTREEGSGMRAVIEEQIMQGARTTPTALVQPTNLDMLDYVAEHPNAIGYIAANIWDNNTTTRTLALDGIAATRENIANGTWPLSQTVFLIVPQNSSTAVSDFVNFLASSAGRATLYRRLSAPQSK